MRLCYFDPRKEAEVIINLSSIERISNIQVHSKNIN